MGGGAMSLLRGIGGGGAGGAVGQLLGILGRPETRTALGALAGGSNPAIPVGASSVPAHAFAGLMGALGREAEAESLASYSGVPTFLTDSSGQLTVDPNDPDQRALRLLTLLHTAPRPLMLESDPGEAFDEYEEYEDFGESDDQEDFQDFDELIGVAS